MSSNFPSGSPEVVAYVQSYPAILIVDHASIAILIYDYLLTLGASQYLIYLFLPISLGFLDEEVRFVWTRTPWNLAKILFLAVRYAVFIPAGLVFCVDTQWFIPLTRCSTGTKAAVYSSVAAIAIAEVVLGLRAWAFWGRSKKVGICIIITIIVLVTVASYKLAHVEDSQGTFSVEVFDLLRHCPPEFSGSDGSSGSSAISIGYMLVGVYESCKAETLASASLT
ncbi:hypothetical protein V5O48_011736 [Marasmius crinis-equi]|uniref:DUF6533 domain-containing protein n=1 Tax=Marasmius crinis-equi TaxID=585013 RepID=A0ABR3F561_9AGAR